jgi:hypothetical protein
LLNVAGHLAGSGNPLHPLVVICLTCVITPPTRSAISAYAFPDASKTQPLFFPIAIFLESTGHLFIDRPLRRQAYQLNEFGQLVDIAAMVPGNTGLIRMLDAVMSRRAGSSGRPASDHEMAFTPFTPFTVFTLAVVAANSR